MQSDYDYDYIVIGSGAAGAVLAARLTEDPQVKVLLLEAGGEDSHPYTPIPLMFLQIASVPGYNWKYESEPEPGLHGRRIAVSRGKTLGGSSSINAMVYSRGHALDYDDWRDAGLPGWGFADVLPYFKRLETHWLGDTPYHGGSGPIQVTQINGPNMLFEPLVEAGRAAGLPRNDDQFGATQEGIGHAEATVGGGRRSSTSQAYLAPARARPNLKVMTGTLATRILIDNARATGVEFVREGAKQRVHAQREVLLCGGSYNSPQLLMLSGIGPADHLREHGIAALHDLPGVGQNLTDQPNVYSQFQLRQAGGMTRYLRADRAIMELARWYLFRDGAFASPGVSASVFLRTAEGLDRPDVQLVPFSVQNSPQNPARLWFPGFRPSPPHCFSLRTGVMRPKSRGWVKLRSADPTDKPRILFNMYAEREDMDAMIRAVRAGRHLFAQSPLREMVEREAVPGSQVDGDEAIEAFARATSTHRSHPVSTCRMGMGTMDVVDGELRVHGITGLRVVDASVMPTIPGSGTYVPTIMVAEKAADLIRGRSTMPSAL